MSRRVQRVVLGSVLLLALLGVAAVFAAPPVSFGSATRDGRRVGEVVIGNSAVIVLRTTESGRSPLERAEIVANRLRAALAAEAKPEQVQVRSVRSTPTVYVSDMPIVPVSKQEAKANRATPAGLAKRWRDNLVLALGGKAGEKAAPTATPPAPVSVQTAATDWNSTAQKWVPIFSLESEGVYLGAAQVAGPKSQVEKVKGVAELRLNVEGFARVYAYVPVSTISVSKLSRVQGVSVWAVGDLALAKF